MPTNLSTTKNAKHQQLTPTNQASNPPFGLPPAENLPNPKLPAKNPQPLHLLDPGPLNEHALNPKNPLKDVKPEQG